MCLHQMDHVARINQCLRRNEQSTAQLYSLYTWCCITNNGRCNALLEMIADLKRARADLFGYRRRLKQQFAGGCPYCASQMHELVDRAVCSAKTPESLQNLF